MEIDDFPDPEELQWLENNNYNLCDDSDIDLDYVQPPSPPSEPEPHESPEPESEEPELPPSKPTLSIPSKPTSIKSQLEINHKKRLLYDVSSHLSESETLRNDGDDKRSRRDDINTEKGSKNGDQDDDDDEDWLRYSPPPPDRLDADVAVVDQEKFLWRYAAEIQGDFLPVTGLDGERVYAKICGVEKMEKVKKFDMKGNSEGLTLEPIRVLMERVEQDELSKALQASEESESQVKYSEEPVNQEKLWVDKYAPNSFKELLSNEQTNREVLLWLKQWDSCVFGSEIKSTEDDVLSSLKRHSLGSQQSKFYSKNFFRNNRETVFSKGTPRSHNYENEEINSSKDIPELLEKQRRQSSPPEEKILLLCGPPGLGKTTLAHVAAKHCGYRVVEINASDDRSSSTIEAKILDVVQMNSVMADSKPKCLIIDEIDGALGDGKGAVDVILKMVSAERKTDVGQEIIAHGEHSGRRSSKKKHSKTSLLRPVICICNDLYAPALRPLRHVAKVHVFVQPTVNRVVKRLKYICNNEGVKASSIALTALTEYTECDIRSCLNTLQFLHKKKKTLNMMEISSQVVGRKDASRSAFDIWKELFQKRKSKQEARSFRSSTNKLNEFEVLLSLISNRGDYDLIFDGIHENILRLHYYDPMMQKTVRCLENLEIYDIHNRYIMRTQHMSLLAYQPTIAIGIHDMVAQIARPVIEWPKSFQRYRSILLEKLDVLRSWHNRISPYISRHLSAKSFVEESISPFLHILSPPTMKPVAPHLLSEKEKILLGQLIDTMVSYAVTYKNVKPGPSPGGQRHNDLSDVLLLSFDPPIDDFISFKGYTSRHLVLASAVKQLLAHEVEKQRILRSSVNRCPSLADADNENHAFSVKTNISQSSVSYCTDISSKQVCADNFSSRGQQQSFSLPKPSNLELQKGATSEEKVRLSEKRKKVSGGSFNFFDRFKKVCNNASQDVNRDIQKPGTMERDMRPLLFKFNEGFTNAVKRPVKIRDFLL